MRIKSIYLLILLLMLSACGSKKRIVRQASEKEKLDKATKEPAKEEERFIFFDISSTEEYIDTFKDIAKSNMVTYGIPASIILAQGILESGSGKSLLTRKTNNHFGIKCHRDWKGDRDYHDDDEKGECFRKYNHPMFSYRDHALFLTERVRYDFLFDIKKSNYKAWARGLKKAGYATDRKYPTKLISIIERYQLFKYDKEVLKGKWEAVQENTTAGSSLPKEKKETYVVVKGDTLYSISRRFGLSVERLMRINKLTDTNIAIGQKLIIKSSR